MKLRADFHIHTHYSVDSSITPEELVKKARKEKLDIIGVVDHGTCKGALVTKKITKGNPYVLVGQEVRTSEGEIVVFGLKNNIKQKKPLKETCKEAKKLGCFIIAPHPFDMFREGIGEHIKDVLEYIDAIEGINARCLMKKFNKKAQEFAFENDKPVVAGSDAHSIKGIGKAVTLIECRKNEKSIFDAIQKGNAHIEGEIAGVTGTIVSKIMRVFKKH